MTPEVREIYDELVKPTMYSRYERLRDRLIGELGYDVFRERQRQAFVEICKVPGAG